MKEATVCNGLNAINENVSLASKVNDGLAHRCEPSTMPNGLSNIVSTANRFCPQRFQLTSGIAAPNVTGFSLTTDEIEFDTPLPGQYKIGDAVIPGLFDHWRNGGTTRLDAAIPEVSWNLWGQNLFHQSLKKNQLH